MLTVVRLGVLLPVILMPCFGDLQCSLPVLQCSVPIQHLEQSHFNNCTEATTVNLSHCHISSLANDTFANMYAIKTLDLSFNNLSFLPDGLFDNMRNLKWLDVSNNRLTGLPMLMFKNKENMLHANLSNNRIQYIPSTVFNFSLTNLRLNLSYNELRAVEPWSMIYDTDQPLWMVDLKHNNISTFTNEFNITYTSSTAKDWYWTDLRYNAFTVWNDSFFTQYIPGASAVHTLRQLGFDIRNNPWLCDCKLHTATSYLQSSIYSYAGDLSDIKCDSPPNLHGKKMTEVLLREFVCNITDGCPRGCFCQQQPEAGSLLVDCRNAGLVELPDFLPLNGYTKIIMHLDNNNITLLNTTSYIKYIVTLTMANNSLTSITDEAVKDVARNDNAYVDFRNNYLTSVPESIQNIRFRNARLDDNPLLCSCDMLWMTPWINTSPNYYIGRTTLACEWKGNLYKMHELTSDMLECTAVENSLLVVLLSVLAFVISVAIITAKRCPYETKVLLYKVFRIHPADKYVVDKCFDKQYDVSLSYDEEDPYVTQWVDKVLVKQIENKKPFFKLAIGPRDRAVTPEAEARLDLFEASRRVLIILSYGYEENEWCQYEAHQTERLEGNSRRIIFLLYDDEAEKMALLDPWRSKMEGRKTLKLGERFFWDKLRYELPRKPVQQRPVPARELSDISLHA